MIYLFTPDGLKGLCSGDFHFSKVVLDNRISNLLPDAKREHFKLLSTIKKNCQE